MLLLEQQVLQLILCSLHAYSFIHWNEESSFSDIIHFFRKYANLYWYHKSKCCNSSESCYAGINMLFPDQHALSGIFQCNMPPEKFCSGQTCSSWICLYLQETKTCWNNNFEDVLSVHCNKTFIYCGRKFFFKVVMQIFPSYPHWQLCFVKKVPRYKWVTVTTYLVA